MSKQIISVQELVSNYDRDQHITLQDLIDYATKNNLNFETCRVLTLHIEDKYVNDGNTPVIQQPTGEFHSPEDYLAFNTIVAIKGDIYLATH